MAYLQAAILQPLRGSPFGHHQHASDEGHEGYEGNEGHEEKQEPEQVAREVVQCGHPQHAGGARPGVAAGGEYSLQGVFAEGHQVC